MEEGDDYKFLQSNRRRSRVREFFAHYFCTVKIVDESYPKPGIRLNIFLESVGNLPSVRSPGDIIKLSRAVLTASMTSLVTTSKISVEMLVKTFTVINKEMKFN
ncbi:hypothetical protein NC653_034533 [Populus alba x Populus x berolinensis]|uniref:Telomeric single stranded DNA binding POT1/Cdc13 domain-containing protein n=2 Tax=Populus TaxID=3689 RepID=A0AAD6PWD3_9ROSI|nr:hypothetical protein NC653_034533 [Populus alba x Populus x berolinensis]